VRVLVTGADGYLGSVLTPELARHGHDVRGVDTGYYSLVPLVPLDPAAPPAARRDVRDLTRADLGGFDAVVHMAELSNDPLGTLDPRVTYEMNHAATVRLAEVARAAGVERFVHMSSCSVYGVASADLVDEDAPLDPQTAYAECKVLVERDVGALAGDDFSPTFLRNATAFGASPRMRFDLVLNNLAGAAWTSGEIRMTSDGTPWRPLVHALDIAQAIVRTLEAPRERVHGQAVNVGSNDQNYQVKEIAEVVGEVFQGCRLTFGELGGDTRSYRVSFDKIRDVLPGFECRWDALRGARQLHDVFREVGLTTRDFESRAFTRLAQLRHLIDTGRIDRSFRWVAR
jgi:nucleoside-diphosphate-sugar epimerase